MHKFRTAKRVLFLALALSMILASLNYLFIYPAFNHILLEETKGESIRLAKHLSTTMRISNAPLRRDYFDEGIIKEINTVKDQFRLFKVNIFSEKGELVFSTRAEEIGLIAYDQPFFKRVMEGKSSAEYIPKNSVTFEGAPISADVVEARIPIIRAGNFIGAFEIYYDISDEWREMHKVKRYFTILLFFLVFVFLLAIGLVATKAEKHRQLHEKAKVELTEEKLKAEKHIRKLSLAMDQSPIAVFVTDADGTLEYVNPMFTRLTDYPGEEVIGKNLADLQAGDMAGGIFPGLWQTVLSGGTWKGEIYSRKRGGESFWELVSVAPIRDTSGAITYAIGFREDITEQKRLEQRLLQSQKMDAVGRLAGGIAHDFNNMLTAIIGYGGLLKEEAGKEPRFAMYIDRILSSSEKAAALTQSLLAFSRRQVINPKPLNLNGAVGEIEHLLLRLIGEDVELKTSLNGSDLTIIADNSQISQVLINLATNARDAMPDGGMLLIETSRAKVTEEMTKKHFYMDPGLYALLSVTDTGAGMDEGTQKNIFEPFFTTKEPGKGTGLGLAIVYGIVKQHNGYINVYSEVGRGTTVKIYLPLVGEREEPEVQAPRMKPAGGTETILIGEDNADVRSFLRDVLETNGYTVIEAEDGEDTVAEFMRHRAAVRLVILDVIMPKKNGKEAFDEISRLRPGAKVLFFSGYTADVIHRKGLLDETLNFISKPILADELLIKVRTILDA